MPLIGAADVSLDVTPTVLVPLGFLRAKSVGLTPDTAFDALLASVVASVTDHLAGYGIPVSSTVARYRLAARHLARHYAAEQVLSAADTGSTRDPEGAGMTLSSGDLAHWQKMSDAGLTAAEAVLGSPPGKRSGVFFAPVRLLSESSDDAST